MEKRVQPEWIKPNGVSRGVKVHNSLKMDEFVDLIPQEGNLLRWYTCGPTVYDSAHLGHARNYITFDIIRRIVEDYFHYEIFYCMNITDIDDKIILRARRNHFFSEFSQKNSTLTPDVITLVQSAWTTEIEELKKKIQKNKHDLADGNKNKQELLAAGSLLEEKLAKAIASSNALAEAKEGEASQKYLIDAQDPLSALLDKSEGANLDAEFIKTLCDAHSKKYEKEFFDDMKRLGVKMPDVLVRVSEYVPEVIEMCNTIISNGFAYVSDGSVYFDSAKFHNDPNHVYGKLAPWSIGNLELLAEGEGALTGGGMRKSEKDFALWKASKPGEPSWDSPWGKGRPGWHIECSAMAGKILGSVLDVHCGGADLKFPHHDNELAQAEAYFANKQWVNYFLHSGHLDINGLKMSKSLKNFISIREALAQHTPKQLRLLFLLQSWDSKMNYQVKDTMIEVDAKDRTFTEFFNKVKSILQLRDDDPKAPENWTPKDMALHDALLQAETQVRAALSSNFNTSQAIHILSDLVTKSNTYMVSNNEKKGLLLSKIAAFVLRILTVFGLDYNFTTSTSTSGDATLESIARPLVSEVTKFRKQVREAAKQKAEHSVFLGLCDSLRDDILPEFGIKVVDDADFSFFFVDKDQLQAEIAKKKADAAEGARLKQVKGIQNKLAAVKKDIDKWEKYQLTPAAVVKARFNIDITAPDALPATDAEGKELSGGTKKQIPKLWSQQVENYTKYQAELEKDPDFLIKLRTLAIELEQALKDLA